MRGVCSPICWTSCLRSSSMFAPHARKTSAAVGLSRRASSKCSTVMNSWRFCRASTKAMCRLTSSSWAIMLRFLHHTLQRVLVLARIAGHLLHLGCGHIHWIDAADPDAFAMHLQHHLRCTLARHREELLQHCHDELHRRVVVVQQHDLEHRRRRELRLARLDYRVVLLLHAAGYRSQWSGEAQRAGKSQRALRHAKHRAARYLTRPL